MLQTTLKREFTRYVSLNIFGMIGISCYILADTFFVALGLGSAGLAALNLAIPAYSLMHGVGMMIGVGGATRYTVCRAQGDEKHAERIFTHAFALALIAGLLFLLLGLFASNPLARLLGADAQTFGMTQAYLKTLLCFGPFFVLNNLMLAFVRNDGAAGRAMFGMLLGSLFNIIFDYIFIFPCGMGMFGAALATGASPIVSLLILSGHLKSSRRGFRLQKTTIRPALFGAVCLPGISTLVSELSSGAVLLLFNLMILRLAGNAGVAAYGVVANLALVAVSIFSGIAQGVQPLASRSLGHGDHKALRRLFRYSVVLALAISSVLYLLIFLFTNPLVAAFNSEGDTALAALAAGGLRIYFLGFWFAGLNIVSAAFFSAVERAQTGFMLSVLRGFAVITPVLLLLAALFGMNGVWATFPVAEAATAAVTILSMCRYFRRTV